MKRPRRPPSKLSAEAPGLSDVARELAQRARRLRERARVELEREANSGPLRRAFHMSLHRSRGALAHDPVDVPGDDFADALAQTITCVLFTARWLPGRATTEPHARITRADLALHCSAAAPPLADLFSSDNGGDLGWIDPILDEIQSVLASADVTSIVGVRGLDPIAHFYEPFLAAYDSSARTRRGVFFTPSPAVSYIVRSVDEILRSDYGLADGLASTETWGSVRERLGDRCLQIPSGARPDEPFVSILDPAAGTGAFVFECINVIEGTVKADLCRALGARSWDDPRVLDGWRAYVPERLLPRICGYELMMAPCAVARLLLSVKLRQTGYSLAASDPSPIVQADALAAPFHRVFSVVLGNPPYAGLSSNMTERARGLADAYKIVDGAALSERKIWLQDDYVKFIRAAQAALAEGAGVLAYITNHGYLKNPTFRGMRRSLMDTFERIRAVDLHGNANLRERCADGSEDGNIFDIRQGVAVCLAARRGSGQRGVYRADLWGSRASKLDFLASNTASTTPFKRLSPDAPHYLFEERRPEALASLRGDEAREAYERGFRLSDIFPLHSAGFITARDHFVIGFDRRSLLAKIADFADERRSDAFVRETYFAGRGRGRYPAGDTRGFRLAEARAKVRADRAFRDRAAACLYRPFDERSIYWADWMVDWPRPEVMRHLGRTGSLALSTSRSVEIGAFEHVFCSRLLIGHHSVSAKEVNHVFPLILWERGEPTVNLSPAFLEALARSLGVSPRAEGGLPQGVKAEDIFGYIYAILHSRRWRSRYFEFIRRDFARIPLPSARSFAPLAGLGARLASHHLLEATYNDDALPSPVGRGPMLVEKVSFSDGATWINKEKTRGFRRVPSDVWDFRVGGYQVCSRFLRDREGRRLSRDEVLRYRRVVAAVSATLELMSAIDELIDHHGGISGAFS